LLKSAFALLDRCGAGAFAAALILIAATGPVSAQENTTGTPDLRDRPYLTGDGSGLRARLEEAGFTIRSRLTQFIQGMPDGDGDNSSEYGGKLDYMVRSDHGKLSN